MLIRGSASLIVTLLLISPSAAGSEQDGDRSLEHLAFFTELSSTEPVKRDQFLDGHLTRILRSKVYIVSVERRTRYNRRVRITATESATTRISITYHLFTDQTEYLASLKKNDAFTFSGVFKVYTPLSSRRDSYLFDIVLVEGTAVD